MDFAEPKRALFKRCENELEKYLFWLHILIEKETFSFMLREQTKQLNKKKDI